MLVSIDELYDLAMKAKDGPYGHPITQVLDNFDNFRCLLTPSLLVELITRLREAERDAARYRWLRDVGQHKYYVDDILACTLRGADGCIDEYMKERGDE